MKIIIFNQNKKKKKTYQGREISKYFKKSKNTEKPYLSLKWY